MKKTFAVLSLFLSFSSFAQETIEMNAESINIDESSAVVARTSKSPDSIELTFRVPMENSICERYETRYVMRTYGSYCGYDYYERRIPVGRVCVRTNPIGHCIRWEETYRFERHERPRTCMVPESYCARFGTATSYETDKMKIKFKNLPALADSETETFSIKATQKRYDSGSVVFEVKPLETLREYQINREKFLFFKKDTFVVSEK